jgi:hypothetical protein
MTVIFHIYDATPPTLVGDATFLLIFNGFPQQ